MGATSKDEAEVEGAVESQYDQEKEIRAFDETKAGVKGLVDAGINKLPRMFIHPESSLEKSINAREETFSIPVIDLEGMDKDPVRRKEIVDKVRDASERGGFFQVVNHGIQVSVLEEMIHGARRFFEQDTKVKKKWYTRDRTKRVVYNCNFDLYSPTAANWRDTTYSVMAPNPPAPEELPMFAAKY